MTKIKIAIDAMGGDFGPEVTVPSSYKFALNHPDVHLILYGDEDRISLYKDNSVDNISIHHSPSHIHMGEKLSTAYRRYLQTSMGQAISSQQNNLVSATVSGGNTGVLMAIAHKVLRPLDGVLRPAIISSFPTKTANDVFVLDLGANIHCTPEHLVQFALMGDFVAKSKGIKTPRVGLLNIGEEKNKGNQLIKDCDPLFKSLPINYVGYIEPTLLYSDEVDVVVCDGFTGNILLKSCEGTSKFLKYIYQEAFTSSLLGSISAFFLKKQLKSKLKKYDPKFRNGAMLIGLNGTVVKSHGSACVDGFYNAITMAYDCAQASTDNELKDTVNKLGSIHVCKNN